MEQITAVKSSSFLSTLVTIYFVYLSPIYLAYVVIKWAMSPLTAVQIVAVDKPLRTPPYLASQTVRPRARLP